MRIHTSVHTSATDPLRIAVVAAAAGEIGISFCPGKHAPRLDGGHWRRDLAADVARISDWGASTVVTLIEDHELRSLRVTGLPRHVRAAGMRWHHLPIADGEAPGAAFDARWPDVAASLCDGLRDGERLFVHCRGGLGRAGMVSAALLVLLGEEAEAAIRRIRAARPGAIETREQERWVARWVPGV